MRRPAHYFARTMCFSHPQYGHIDLLTRWFTGNFVCAHYWDTENNFQKLTFAQLQFMMKGQSSDDNV